MLMEALTTLAAAGGGAVAKAAGTDAWYGVWRRVADLNLPNSPSLKSWSSKSPVRSKGPGTRS